MVDEYGSTCEARNCSQLSEVSFKTNNGATWKLWCEMDFSQYPMDKHVSKAQSLKGKMEALILNLSLNPIYFQHKGLQVCHKAEISESITSFEELEIEKGWSCLE